MSIMIIIVFKKIASIYTSLSSTLIRNTKNDGYARVTSFGNNFSFDTNYNHSFSFCAGEYKKTFVVKYYVKWANLHITISQ